MGNYGCGGGSLRNTLKYLDKTGGLMAYADYPYVARVSLHIVYKNCCTNIFLLQMNTNNVVEVIYAGWYIKRNTKILLKNKD